MHHFTWTRVLGIIVTTNALIVPLSAHARAIYPGDIVGRDLNYPLLGYLGHVGIAMGDTLASQASHVIEALNKNPVIQINSLQHFKQQSKYWGSRYGIGDQADGTRKALAEANHQRWLCPTYTDSTAYTIGETNPKTGQITKCGVWRCDTLIAWSFFSAGYPELLEHKITLPRNMFHRFPYTNNETHESTQVTHNYSAPMQKPRAPDKTTTVPNFISMYEAAETDAIKTKLLQGMMIYYQSNRNQLDNMPKTHAALKQFYATLLEQKPPMDATDIVVRGYLDFHTPHEILTQLKTINKHLQHLEPHARLGLQHNLAYTSEALESIYIPAIISMLNQESRSDLDDMFFGLTNISYPHLKHATSIQDIKHYMHHVAQKYTWLDVSGLEHTPLNTNHTPNDPYFNLAKASFYELSQQL